jgi:beta-phosphoglucomutase-like phosphatase (HAD superfamily)
VLIFDLDGALLDSMTCLLDIFCHLVYEQRNIEPDLSRAVAVALMGMNTRFQIAEVLSRAGLPQTGLDTLYELCGQRAALLEPRTPVQNPGRGAARPLHFLLDCHFHPGAPRR